MSTPNQPKFPPRQQATKWRPRSFPLSSSNVALSQVGWQPQMMLTLPHVMTWNNRRSRHSWKALRKSHWSNFKVRLFIHVAPYFLLAFCFKRQILIIDPKFPQVWHSSEKRRVHWFCHAVCQHNCSGNPSTYRMIL